MKKVTFDSINERSGTETFHLACFEEKIYLLFFFEQLLGDCESRVKEARFAGCIHATASFSYQIAGPLSLASERASI